MEIIKITTKDFGEVKPFLNGATNYVSEDNGVIEVIVGWELAKEKGASILSHKMNDTTYWTFLPREKRKIFQDQIKSFIVLGYKKLIDGLKIKNLNPLLEENPQSFINKIENDICGGKGYLYSDRLYVYNGEIYHIDMGLLDFMSWDIKDKIVKMIDMIEVDLNDFKDELKYVDLKYIPYIINAEKSNTSSNIH